MRKMNNIKIHTIVEIAIMPFSYFYDNYNEFVNCTMKMPEEMSEMLSQKPDLNVFAFFVPVVRKTNIIISNNYDTLNRELNELQDKYGELLVVLKATDKKVNLFHLHLHIKSIELVKSLLDEAYYENDLSIMTLMFNT